MLTLTAHITICLVHDILCVQLGILSRLLFSIINSHNNYQLQFPITVF